MLGNPMRNMTWLFFPVLFFALSCGETRGKKQKGSPAECHATRDIPKAEPAGTQSPFGVKDLAKGSDATADCVPAPGPIPPLPLPKPDPEAVKLTDVSLSKLCTYYLGDVKNLPNLVMVGKMLTKYRQVFTDSPFSLNQLATKYCEFKKDDAIGFDCARKDDGLYLQGISKGFKEDYRAISRSSIQNLSSEVSLEGVKIPTGFASVVEACEKPDEQQVSNWCAAQTSESPFCSCNMPNSRSRSEMEDSALQLSSLPSEPPVEVVKKCAYGGKLVSLIDQEYTQCEKTGGSYLALKCSCAVGQQFNSGSGCYVPPETKKCQSWGGKSVQGSESDGPLCQCADGVAVLSLTEFRVLASKEAFDLVCKSKSSLAK